MQNLNRHNQKIKKMIPCITTLIRRKYWGRNLKREDHQTIFDKGVKFIPRTYFSTNGVKKEPDIHMQNDEVAPLSYTIYKN